MYRIKNVHFITLAALEIEESVNQVNVSMFIMNLCSMRYIANIQTVHKYHGDQILKD